MAEPRLSIVVAVQGGEENLPEILANLCNPATEGVEVIVVSAGSAPAGIPAPGPRVLEASPDSLVPHLWRDGVRVARSGRVAFTNCQCIPPAGWVQGLLDADMDRWAAVGGPISIAPGAGAVDWAVFFLRYMSFAPPILPGQAPDVAADNAIYRRAEVMKHPDLLAVGFWEPSFHQRFHDAGLALSLDPRLLLAYRGPQDPGRFIAHRFAHGRAFGLARSREARPWRRLLYVLASPAVPVVLLQRIVRKAFGKPGYGSRLIPALPWLVLFCLAWSAGEARGCLDALAVRSHPAEIG